MVSRTGEAFPKGERLCLAAMAMHGDQGVTRPQLTVLTGYKRSTRDAYIQRLNERGFVGFIGDRVGATDAGIEALGEDYEPLPTGSVLRSHWLGRLPAGEAAVLEVLLAAYPKALDREVIGEHTNFKRSTRDAYIQRLSTRELVTAERGGLVRAAEHLFDERSS